MSGPAHYAAFKSQTAALVEKLHLTAPETIGLGLALAASHAVSTGIARAAVAKALAESFDAAEAKLPGIVKIGGVK